MLDSFICLICYYDVLTDAVSIIVFSEVNRSYQMSSFVETKALEQLTKTPVEFVEYLFYSVNPTVKSYCQFYVILL